MSNLFGCALVLLFLGIVQRGYSLSCWTCSSDVDPQFCRDPFNETEIRRRDYGSGYNAPQRYPEQNYRNYDQNNRNYNPQGYNQQGYNQQGYNNQPYNQQGYNQPGYNQQGFYGQGRLTAQFFVNCNDEEARLKRMKNVCVKKVQRRNVNDVVTVIRRCEMVDPSREVGTCNDPVDRGVTLDFCEYCENDGCNGATGLRTSFLLSLLPVAVFWIFKQ